MHTIKSHLEREDGQTMAEFSIVLAVITVAIVTVFGVLSGAIQAGIGNAGALI